MKYNFIGNSGLAVSQVSLGNWLNCETDFSIQNQIFNQAYNLGVNHFDTAQIYGDGQAELNLGRIIKANNWDRDKFIISSKVFASTSKPSQNPNLFGLSRKSIQWGVKGSLKRLGLDYIDILYLHRPDHQVPLRETIRTIAGLLDNNKIDYWGTSCFDPADLSAVYDFCEQYGVQPPIVEQSRYNMLDRERVESTLYQFFEQYQMGLAAWSPLHGGILTGKYNHGDIPQNSRYDTDDQNLLSHLVSIFGNTKQVTINILQGLNQIAQQIGCTQAQLCLAWILKNKDISTAITGATTISQLQENVQSVHKLDLIDEQINTQIESLLSNKPQPFLTFRSNPNDVWNLLETKARR